MKGEIQLNGINIFSVKYIRTSVENEFTTMRTEGHSYPLPAKNDCEYISILVGRFVLSAQKGTIMEESDSIINLLAALN